MPKHLGYYEKFIKYIRKFTYFDKHIVAIIYE